MHDLEAGGIVELAAKTAITPPLAFHCLLLPSSALHCSALYCGALSCTVAPGRVVCQAWFVFWHPVILCHVTTRVTSKPVLWMCLVGSFCFQLLHFFALHCIGIALYCRFLSCTVAPGRVVASLLVSRLPQRMLKPSKGEAYCIIALRWVLPCSPPMLVLVRCFASYHVQLRRGVLWPLIWCHVWRVISRPVMTFLPATCLMSSHCGCFWYDVWFKVSASWHVCSSRVMSCHVMSCCVTSCPVISARVTLGSSSGILSPPFISFLVTMRLTSNAFCGCISLEACYRFSLIIISIL